MHTVRTDNRGVSPVIGVILMVAITVLLAATAAAFVLELGNDNNREMTPNAAFDVDYDDDTGSDVLVIEHNTGDDLRVEQLSIVVSGATPGGVDARYPAEAVSSYGKTNVLTAGETITLDKSPGSLDTGSDIDLSKATVKLVWKGSGMSQSKVLREWKGPDAS